MWNFLIGKALKISIFKGRELIRWGVSLVLAQTLWSDPVKLKALFYLNSSTPNHAAFQFGNISSTAHPNMNKKSLQFHMWASTTSSRGSGIYTLATPKASQVYKESLSQMGERIKKTNWELLWQAVNSVIDTAWVGGNSSFQPKGRTHSWWNRLHGRCKLAAGFHSQPSSEAGAASRAHLQEGHTVHWDQSWQTAQNNQTNKSSPIALFDLLY